MQSLDVISGYADKLEAANHTGLLCHVYAAVNRRPVDDPALKQYFLRRGWIPGTHTHALRRMIPRRRQTMEYGREQRLQARASVRLSSVGGRGLPARPGGRQADAAPDWLTRTS